MIQPLFPANDSVAGVRRPVLEMSFGNGGGGIAGGLAAAAIAAGGSAWQQHVVSVVVTTGRAPAVNHAEVIVAATEQAPTAEVGQEGEIRLGYDDDGAEAVLAGTVASLRPGLAGSTRLTATDGGAALARLRVNQSYQQQTAGEIVRDLAAKADVATGTIEDGASFPFYVADACSNAYEHIARLARKSNHAAHFTPDGKLQFAPSEEGDPVQTFAPGVDVLSLEVTETGSFFDAATIIGEGAAGSQGQDAWSWLVKDSSTISATSGTGDIERVVRDASLRSVDAARGAAQAYVAAAASAKLTGTLLVPGAPKVAVASTIEITDAPTDGLNGRFQVNRVQHRYSKRAGFTTRIVFSKVGGAAGGLL